MAERLDIKDSIQVWIDKINAVLDLQNVDGAFVNDDTSWTNTTFELSGGKVRSGTSVLDIPGASLNLPFGTISVVGVDVPGEVLAFHDSGSVPATDFIPLYTVTTNNERITGFEDIRTWAYEDSGAAADAVAEHEAKTDPHPNQEVTTATGTQSLADAIDQRGPVFDDVADLDAATNLQIGQHVRTLGYYTPGDGGGNDYEIVAAGTGTDDGGSFIDLSGSGLQAKGLHGPSVTIRQFGAVGDGVTDDTTSIQSSFDSGAKFIKIPEGEYLVSSTFPDPALTCSTPDVRVRGDGVLTVDQNTRRLAVFSGAGSTISMNIDGKDLLNDGIRVTADRCIVENSLVENLFSDANECFAISGYDVSGGFIARNNIVRNVEATAAGFSGFARGIHFFCTEDATEESIISGNLVENIIGTEGDSIIVLATPGTGLRSVANVTIRDNVVKNFTRRGIKVQGWNVRVLNNMISHTFTSAGQMSSVRNAIDFVQCREGVISGNILQNCKFCKQINVDAESGYSFNDITISNNTIVGLGTETPDTIIFASPRAGGLVIKDNVVKGGTGRFAAIGVCDNFVLKGNVITLEESVNVNPGDAAISTISSTQSGVISDNVLYGAERDCFVRIETSNLVIRDNHIKASGTALHRVDSSDRNNLLMGNSVDDDGGYFIGSLVSQRAGGTHYFSDNLGGWLGYLVAQNLSEYDNIEVRAGQVIINVGTAGPLAWRADSSGLGSAITWTSFT